MSGPGQSFDAERVMVVVIDTNGKAHGWDVAPGTASWRWTGLHPTLGSTVKIEIEGPMRRRTRDLEDLEAELQPGSWELPPMKNELKPQATEGS